MDAIRVLLVEDYELVRAGLKALVERSGHEVVGEARNGREALALIEECKPDLVLMDIVMPEMNGLDTTARIRERHGQLPVLLLSSHSGEDYVQEGLDAGASGYLLKNAEEAELSLAMRAVMRGESYLSPAVTRTMIGRKPGQAGTGISVLTPRQRQVLQLVAEGNSSKAIARKLGLSAKTVENHRAQLMQRLDVHDIAGLVRYAIRSGLVALD